MKQPQILKIVFFFFIFILFRGGLYADNNRSIVYVSVNGNDDSNDGSFTRPYKTINKALINSNKIAHIIIRGGDYNEIINISGLQGRQQLTIESYSGERVRLLCGNKIEKAEKVKGFNKVLKTDQINLEGAPKYKLFQHDVEDKTTLIRPEERHPLQKGRLYRCNSTPLSRVESIEDIESADSPSFYYDTTSKALYFSIVEGSDLNSNPVYQPIANGIYGGNYEVKLTVIGLEVLYGAFNVSKCSGARILDCAVKYAFNGGGFLYNMSVGIEFIRCEAARTFTGSGNGDGFNGHSRVSAGTHPEAKHTSVLLVDCWAHDNYDDGYSNHERCEGVVRGGLFEYNNKFGLGSGYGAHESVYGAISRNNNQYGFAICADILKNEGGYASQMILHNCIASENGKAGYVAYTSKDPEVNPNSMVLYDCYSVNNKVGFEVRDNTTLMLINCKDSGSEKLFQGTPIIKTIENLK